MRFSLNLQMKNCFSSIMDVNEFQRELIESRSILFQEKFLDDMFKQLYEMQNNGSHGFVAGIFSEYFERSAEIIKEIDKTLQQSVVDFEHLRIVIHELKGSSSIVGVQRVTEVCCYFRNLCNERNLEKCLRSMQQLKNELSFVESKLKTMFKLEEQILASGGSIPTMV